MKLKWHEWIAFVMCWPFRNWLQRMECRDKGHYRVKGKCINCGEGK